MFCVLHFPQFSLQAALRHEPDLRSRPVALVETAGTTPRVIGATPAARLAGVTHGLTAPQALARCRDVVLRSRSPASEMATTEAIVQCAFGFSPNLETTAPGLLTMDLRGLAQLDLSPGNAAGGPGCRSALRAWAGRLQTEVQALGLDVSIGLAETPAVARQAARWPDAGAGDRACPTDERNHGPIRVVEAAAAFVAGLPIAALDPSSDVEELLHRWGVRNVGEMLALGQAELAERLGLEALALFAAASVTAVRPLRLVQPSERFEEVHDFEPPVETLEPLLFLLQRFVNGLVRRLEPLGLAAGELVLRLQLESAAVLERRLPLPEPSRRPDILFRVLHTHLEGVRADAPVQSVRLEVVPARPRARQFGLFETAIRDPHQFHETLARLAALVGPERVGTPVREPGHRPETFRLVPPDFESAPAPGAANGANPAPAPELLRNPPMRRLRPALPAAVETAAPGAGEVAGSPLALNCSLARGRLVIALGPYRASGHWWDERAWAREEWDVAARSDAVLRLVHEGGSWRVEAMLD